MTFANKTILLTGASSGIGKALARKLALIDCTLILLARRDNLIDEYLSELKNKRAEIIIEKCDVADKSSVSKSMSIIRNKVKEDINLAILNAGTSYRMEIENFNSKHAEEIFNVNVFGIVYWVEQYQIHLR